MASIMNKYFPIVLLVLEMIDIISSIKKTETGRITNKNTTAGKIIEKQRRESFSILFLHELKNFISECCTPNEIIGCIKFEIAKRATISP